MPTKKNTALMRIVAEAKRLRREYPKRFATWREYVAQASAIYSSKHSGHSPIGKKKPMRKKTHHRKHASKRKVGRSSTGIMTRSRTHTDYNRNKVNITVGAVNKHKKAAREKLLKMIERAAGQRFVAKLKRVKKKIAKKEAQYKAEYRRLC